MTREPKLERFEPTMYIKYEENDWQDSALEQVLRKMSKVFKMFKMGRTNEFKSKVESSKELEVKQGHKPGNNRSSRRSANIQKMKYQRCNNFQLFAKCEIFLIGYTQEQHRSLGFAAFAHFPNPANGVRQEEGQSYWKNSSAAAGGR